MKNEKAKKHRKVHNADGTKVKRVKPAHVIPRDSGWQGSQNRNVAWRKEVKPAGICRKVQLMRLVQYPGVDRAMVPVMRGWK